MQCIMFYLMTYVVLLYYEVLEYYEIRQADYKVQPYLPYLDARVKIYKEL